MINYFKILYIYVVVSTLKIIFFQFERPRLFLPKKWRRRFAPQREGGIYFQNPQEGIFKIFPARGVYHPLRPLFPTPAYMQSLLTSALINQPIKGIAR